MAETSSGKPWKEFDLLNGDILRVFDKDFPEEDLVWHRDHEDRRIYVIESRGWKLQMDNKEPVHLFRNFQHTIQKDEYHRLIKGHGNLVIRVKKL